MREENIKLIQPISEIAGELALDSQLADGVLKEIPIVKTIWAAYNAGKSIQEHFYLKKLSLFLENIKDLDEDDYQDFLKDAEDNAEKISDSLLLILDKIEDETKAILIANAFKIYVREKLSFEIFTKILLIINRGFCSDLLSILVFEGHDKLLTNNKHIQEESLIELFSCGLLVNVGIDGGNVSRDDGGIVYSLNRYGEIFLRVVKGMGNHT